MAVRYVKQRGGHDCGIAALAMATGRAYEDVLAPFAWRINAGEGLNEFHMFEWFVRNGWAYQQIYKVHHMGGVNQPREEWPPRPWAPVHLIEVRVSAGYHFAVMDSHGRVFDPWDAERTFIGHPAYQDLCWVMGLWPVPAPQINTSNGPPRPSRLPNHTPIG